MENNNKWWKNAFIYQIYPRSFKDGNNDGMGDLKGIIDSLDYLQYLGIDAIWLSPVYQSPMDDNGYDVSDYHQIASEFGTMEDMDTLIKEGKKRNIRIIMDLVANHTSCEHMWFKEALKSKDNPYHDYYYWFDKVENDKQGDFGSGSSFTYVPELNSYYFHSFAKSQIDLNWPNPKVRQEVADMVKFWLDKGVAGFRMDAIELIGKDIEKQIYANGPRIHEYLHELNENSFGKYPESITVGEGWPTPEIALEYVAPERKELDMMFNFELVSLRWGNKYGKWDATKATNPKMKEVFSKWQHKLYNKGWNTLFIENHDLTRSVNCIGNPDKYRVESAKAMAYVLYLQQGTPYIYQGQEIGMTNANFENLEDYKDIDSQGTYNSFVNERKIATHEEMMGYLKNGSRDNSRTPMQWNNKVNAGFNEGTTPWIAVNKNYKEINVESQIKDKDSILNAYKEFIEFRKNSKYSKVILDAPYVDYLPDDENLIVYSRLLDNHGLLVVSNFTDKENKINLDLKVNKILLSNYKDSKNSIKDVTLRPYETIVFEM